MLVNSQFIGKGSTKEFFKWSSALVVITDAYGCRRKSSLNNEQLSVLKTLVETVFKKSQN